MGDEGIQLASISELTKAIHQHNAIFAICLQISPAKSKIQPTHPDMEAILHEFADILKEPTGLPPARGVDHDISLKDGTEPINVRPYRYAYYQKEEIEKQVQEMLNSGLIRHSTSPFSSPVLLVKNTKQTQPRPRRRLLGIRLSLDGPWTSNSSLGTLKPDLVAPR